MADGPGGGEAASGLLVVGRIRRAHGIRGEAIVEAVTSHPDEIFVEGRSLYLASAESSGAVDVAEGTGDAEGAEDGGGEAAGLRMERVRPHRNGWIVAFEGVDSRSAAAALVGRELLLPMEALQPLEADEVFVHDLIGLEVRLTDGTPVGPVQAVFEARPADLLEVRMGDRLVLVPFTRVIVRDVDVEAGTLVIDPPEGLLDL